MLEYANAKGPRNPESSGQSRVRAETGAIKLETDLGGPPGWDRLGKKGPWGGGSHPWRVWRGLGVAGMGLWACEVLLPGV